MKFKEYLEKPRTPLVIGELAMKSDTDITITKDSKTEFTADILVDRGRTDVVFSHDLFHFYAFMSDVYPSFSEWTVDFVDEAKNVNIARKDKGVSLRLFAALEEVFTKFVKKKKPDMIKFSSADFDKSRLKLYDLLARKVQKKGGYIYTHPQNIVWKLYKPDLYKKLFKE